jgi:hypothetical protein
MGYNDLSECTLSDDERWQEKNRIVRMLTGVEMTFNERQFIDRITSDTFVSVKQLFYLRDILAKY